MRHSNWVLIGSVCAGLAVILGAFGAHFLAERLSEKQLSSFKTGVLYQMIHGLAILIVTAINMHYQSRAMVIVQRLFLIGIVFFSGSIYLLSCRDLLHITSIGIIGPITPLGGLCFIAGWTYLIYLSSKWKAHE